MNSQPNEPKEPTANFDFIMNQSGKDPEPKKKKGKIIVLFVLVTAVIIVGIAGLLLAPSKRVVEVEYSDEQLSQQQTVKDYLNLVDQGKLDEAYAMLDQETPPITKEEFLNQAVPFLKALKLGECTYKTVDAPNTTQETRPVAICYTFQQNLRIDQLFEISKDNPRTIVNYGYIDLGAAE